MARRGNRVRGEGYARLRPLDCLILFIPDCYRRPRIRTGSAGPPPPGGALAGSPA